MKMGERRINLLRAFNAREGVGIILISDEIQEVLQHCNRVHVMREGRIEAVIENPQNVSESDVFDIAAAQTTDAVK